MPEPIRNLEDRAAETAMSLFLANPNDANHVTNNFDRFPSDVGILAMDIYFPKRCIEQSALEEHDGVVAGKYTIGLGQEQLGFCDDREDVNSIALTVVYQLMKKYKIDYKSIGRLEVGTETLVDKSKSVKTHLMQLFAKHGNYNIEGISTTNACYGGTSALFNAVQWMESSYWDGRFAIVVAADIAIYASGNARPTSGAGAVAMLIGPNAPIVMERGLRGTFMENVYDFYKPNLSSEYPEVDGPLSISCYMKAVDRCYNSYAEKVSKQFLNDFLRYPNDSRFKKVPREMEKLVLEETYADKDVEKTFVALSHEFYSKFTEPSLFTCKKVGNMYCASLYASLISVLSIIPSSQLLNKRLLMFSYGSGLASSMFSFVIKRPIDHIVETVDLVYRLKNRMICTPQTFEKVMEVREKTHNACDYIPKGDIRDLFEGTFYLEKIDSKFRRTYRCTSDE